jgi:hypothetical protein
LDGVEEPGVVESVLGVVVASEDPDVFVGQRDGDVLGPGRRLVASGLALLPLTFFYLITVIRRLLDTLSV